MNVPTLEQLSLKVGPDGKFLNLNEIIPQIKAAAEKAGVPLDEAMAKIRREPVGGNGNGGSPALSPQEAAWRDEAARELSIRRGIETTGMGVDLVKSMLALSDNCAARGWLDDSKMLEEKAHTVLDLIKEGVRRTEKCTPEPVA